MMNDMGQVAALAREAKKRRIEEGLKAYKNPLEKLDENPASLRLSINAMSYDCIGQDSDPNWRDSIRECPCNKCPLFNVRPYRPKD